VASGREPRSRSADRGSTELIAGSRKAGCQGREGCVPAVPPHHINKRPCWKESRTQRLLQAAGNTRWSVSRRVIRKFTFLAARRVEVGVQCWWRRDGSKPSSRWILLAIRQQLCGCFNTAQQAGWSNTCNALFSKCCCAVVLRMQIVLIPQAIGGMTEPLKSVPGQIFPASSLTSFGALATANDGP